MKAKTNSARFQQKIQKSEILRMNKRKILKISKGVTILMIEKIQLEKRSPLNQKTNKKKIGEELPASKYMNYQMKA